jgi:hypothetical protein
MNHFWKGIETADGRLVRHYARPKTAGERGSAGAGGARAGQRPSRGRNEDWGPREMRVFVCHEQRMTRGLHGRWPYRRSHCRHDLHWLVRIRQQTCLCDSARKHSLGGLRAYSRRP